MDIPFSFCIVENRHCAGGEQVEKRGLIAPEPHTPETDLRLRRLMEVEDAVENYVQNNEIAGLNRLLCDPDYETLCLKRMEIANRHEIWNIAQLSPDARRARLMPYRQLGFHCYRRQLNSIPCVRLIYAYSGQIRIVVEGQTLILDQDELCLLNADVDYTISAVGSDDFFIDCFFTKYYLSNVLMPRLPRDNIFTPFFEQALFGSAFSGDNTYIAFHRSPSDKVLRFLIYSIFAFAGNVPVMDEVLSSYVFLIYHDLLIRYSNEKTVSPKAEGVPPNASELVDYIFANFDTVTLASASEHFHFNPAYMGRLVKRLTGESFVDLVRNIRLVKAAELIETTDRAITAIANDVGYQNISHFYRLFQEHYSCTPAEFREQKRAQPTQK